MLNAICQNMIKFKEYKVKCNILKLKSFNLLKFIKIKTIFN